MRAGLSHHIFIQMLRALAVLLASGIGHSLEGISLVRQAQAPLVTGHSAGSICNRIWQEVKGEGDD